MKLTKEKIKVKYTKLDLPKNDEPLWEGRPRISSVFTQQKVDIVADFKPMLYMLIVVVSPLYLFLLSTSTLTFSLIMIILTLYFMVKYWAIRNTSYKVSERGIHIDTWTWWKRESNLIPYAEIGDLTVEWFNDSSVTIHFLPKSTFRFKTRNLITGEKRHYPTFELLAGGVEVEQLIRQLIKESRS